MTAVLKPMPTGGGDFAPMDRLWSREEYYRLVELGFFDGQRVELIEGRIVQMSPQRVPHSISVELVDRCLRKAFPKEHRIRIQLPFHSQDGSEPEPDFAVIVGEDPRAASEHPSSAALVIEISDTTLEHDRHKARLYAASGVVDYWIVNLSARALEVHRNPVPSGGASGGPVYADIRTISEQETITPLAAPGVRIVVAELLP